MFLDTGAIGIFQFKSSKVTILLLITSCCVFATTQGYDSALMNGINILPSYRQTLNLTTATYSLNTAASFIGWGIASMLMGPVVERIGRKSGIVLSVILKLSGILFMTAAQNVAMFVIGRILLGTGTCTAAIASSSWLAETLPSEMRGMGLSITYSVYYVGSLLCAGVTYGTASMPGSWSWRLPCLLQSIFSLCCAAVLLFVPESPRWLVYQDRVDDALTVIASTHADGDRTNPVVLQLHKEITDTLTWERSQGKKPTYQEMLKTPNSRRRLALCLSVAVISMLSGNNIITYYLGDMLEGAGITSETTKLRINIILSAFCLVCAMVGTFSMDRVGRKSMCLGACVFMTIMLFLVGALTKVFGSGGNNSGVYGTVAAIFLFQGSYSVGITPITTLYSAEILSYSIRSNGMAAWSMTVTAGGLFCTFVFPFALDAISWKLYMINGAWDVLQCIYVAFCWIETKGLTLEEIDGKLDGIKQQSNVLDLEDLKKDIIVEDLEVNINSKGTSSG